MKNSYLAVIDLGSHELSLTINLIREDLSVQEIESLANTLAVGVDTYTAGRISEEVISQIMLCLAGFLQKCKEYPGIEIKAVATSAFREASNAFLVLNRIKNKLKLEVEVLAQSQEVYYHHLALFTKYPKIQELIKEASLIIDLGAGSVQLTLYANSRFVYSQNLKLGSLRVRELLAELEYQTLDFNALIAEYIAGELNYYRSFEPKKTKYQNLIVFGGSLPYLRQVLGRESQGTILVPASDFDQVLARLKNSKTADLIREYGLASEHASLLLPTAILIAESIKITELETICFSEVKLADGIALSLAGQQQARAFDQDLIFAARELARRYKTDKKHSEQVRFLALELFSQLRSVHNLDERFSLLLELSALLHNIGQYISMTSAHKRSYEIIMATTLIGLSQEEQRLLAATVYCHNSEINFKDKRLAPLSAENKIALAKLVALISLANSLDAGHSQKIKRLKLKRRKNSLRLFVYSDDDLTLEIWQTKAAMHFFKNVYGLDLKIIQKQE